MNHQPIVDRTIRSNGGRVRDNCVPVRSFDLHALAIFNFHDARPSKNAAAKIDNPLRKHIQILQGMKLRLPWNTQHAIGIEFSNWHTIDTLDIGQTGAMNRVQFAF